MKPILRNSISLEREIELTQNLFWLFVDERLKTMQQKHETFEIFLELLDQLIESEKNRTPTRGKTVAFAIKEEEFIFDSNNPPNYPPIPEHFVQTYLTHSRSLYPDPYQ